MKRKIIFLLLTACMVAGFIPLLQINAQAINTEAVFNNGSAENSTVFSNAQTNIEQTYAKFIINKGRPEHSRGFHQRNAKAAAEAGGTG